MSGWGGSGSIFAEEVSGENGVRITPDIMASGVMRNRNAAFIKSVPRPDRKTAKTATTAMAATAIQPCLSQLTAKVKLKQFDLQRKRLGAFIYVKPFFRPEVR